MCHLKFILVIIYLVEVFVPPALDGNNKYIEVQNSFDDKGTGNVLGIEFHNGAMENNKSLHSYGLYQTSNSMWQLSVLYRLWKGLVFDGCQNRNETLRFIRHTYFTPVKMERWFSNKSTTSLWFVEFDDHDKFDDFDDYDNNYYENYVASSHTTPQLFLHPPTRFRVAKR